MISGFFLQIFIGNIFGENFRLIFLCRINLSNFGGKSSLHFLCPQNWGKALFMMFVQNHLSCPAKRVTMNQQPPVQHPLDVRYYSVLDEPQLS
jgi:hypothetical protein